MQSPTQPGRGEFVVLAASLMSTIALSIDLMLPAFQEMSDHFALAQPNDRQAIITMVFVGLLIGQLFCGPLSDYIGRKPAILAGIALHTVGSVLCIFADDYTVLLIGRFLQGMGGAAARIVIVAMVRDRFVGQNMAKVMSIVLTVFILVPVFAPALGEVLLLFGPWQFLFVVLSLVAITSCAWLYIRQPETHTDRAPFEAGQLISAVKTVLTTPVSIIYALAAGCGFGTLLGYIVSAQQVLQDLYQTGSAFAIYFGVSAGFVALSTIVNAWLLNRHTMEAITFAAIVAKGLWAALFLAYFWLVEPVPPLWLWMVFITTALFLVGITFGNYNAISLRPLGHIAGIASSVTASIQTLVSVVVAGLTGAAFAMNITPVAFTALLMSVLSIMLMMVGWRLSPPPSAQALEAELAEGAAMSSKDVEPGASSAGS
ncbi:MAG: multidrug effflux MFS transporter [Cohaesibacteraceae bacterium]